MKCLHCTHLKSHPIMSKSDFGSCMAHKLTGVFVSMIFERECGDFQIAPDVETRIDWHNKQEK